MYKGGEYLRYLVSKKGIKPLVFPTILYNFLILLMLVITSIDGETDAKYVMIILIFTFLTLDGTLFYLYMQCLSVVLFSNTTVECYFLKKKRRSIPYDEILEFGDCWIRGVKYIYITRMMLSNHQREEKLFDLYRKTRDVIVFEYQEDVMQFLKQNYAENLYSDT